MTRSSARSTAWRRRDGAGDRDGAVRRHEPLEHLHQLDPDARATTGRRHRIPRAPALRPAVARRSRKATRSGGRPCRPYRDVPGGRTGPGSDRSVHDAADDGDTYDGTSLYNSASWLRAPGSPTSFELTFPDAGSFNYICALHVFRADRLDQRGCGGAVDHRAADGRRADRTDPADPVTPWLVTGLIAALGGACATAVRSLAGGRTGKHATSRPGGLRSTRPFRIRRQRMVSVPVISGWTMQPRR